MSQRPLLDRIRRVRATRASTGCLLLVDADTGERLTQSTHYTEPGWVQLLLQAEGRLEADVSEAIFLFVPVSDRPRF
jgi:hypothetical protein